MLLRFLGYSLNDWVELIGVSATLISGGSWIFKQIALNPLREDIKRLADAFDAGRRATDKEIQDVNCRLSSHDRELGIHSERLTRLEDKVGYKGEDNE